MSGRAIAALALVLGLAGACSDKDEDSDKATAPGARGTVDWALRLSEGGVEALLEATAQTHLAVRRSVGPHRMTYDATFSQAPERETEELPPLDSAVHAAYEIKDHLELTWVGNVAGDPTFSLVQSNDQDRGRDVTAVGGRLYTRLKHRGWVESVMDTQVQEVWLDDAQHAVYDTLLFAAPSLAVAVEPDGSTIVATLSRAEEVDDAMRSTDPAASWRSAATIESVDGTVQLDAASGAWQTAEIAVQYRVEGPGGRMLRGSMALRAQMEPLAPQEATVSPPTGAVPVPLRPRYEPERERVLDGLAAP